MNEVKIAQIKKAIITANDLLLSTNKNTQFKFIERTIKTWSDKKNSMSKGLMTYESYNEEGFFELNLGVKDDPCKYDWNQDLQQLIDNLKILQEEYEQVTQKTSSCSPSIKITNTNINSNVIEISLSNTIDSLKNSTLSKDELIEIMAMLSELNDLNSKKKETKWEKAKKILA